MKEDGWLSNDDYIYRRRYLVMSMNKVYRIPNLESIAVAKLFACGGSQKLWQKSYFNIIQKYAKKFP